MQHAVRCGSHTVPHRISTEGAAPRDDAYTTDHIVSLLRVVSASLGCVGFCIASSYILHGAQESLAKYAMATMSGAMLPTGSEQCALIYANIGLLTSMLRGRRREEHMCNLQVSIRNVVRATEPDIFCMCEVGSYACTNIGALTEEEMKTVCRTVCVAWKSATGTQPGYVYEWPHPYLTLYNTNAIEIKKASIVPTFIASAQKQRFAQTLSCAMHDCEPFDVWNIHNPCPSRPNNLTDRQREQSLDTILRASSNTDVGKPPGERSVVFGGDMNINYEMMCSLMEKLGPPRGLLWCNDQAAIRSAIFKPTQVAKNYSAGTPGCTPEDSPDFCIACNLRANNISFEVQFPIEPKAHVPYGIRIKCEHLLSPPRQEQTQSNSIQESDAHESNRRWTRRGYYVEEGMHEKKIKT